MADEPNRHGNDQRLRPAWLIFSAEDRKTAVILFAGTLAANVATLFVGAIAILAYHLGGRPTPSWFGTVFYTMNGCAYWVGPPATVFFVFMAGHRSRIKNVRARNALWAFAKILAGFAFCFVGAIAVFLGFYFLGAMSH